MRLRSLLFVPADSERKFDRALASGVDAIILDLEDSVTPDRKAEARGLLPDHLAKASAAAPMLFVRVNAFDTGDVAEDLRAAVRGGLRGILLPKANGLEDVERLAELLDECERDHGMSVGGTVIGVVATETPRAIFNLGSYAEGHPRLAFLTWGAEDLAAAIGASANKEEDGEWTAPYRHARSLCLFAAAAAGVPAIDTLYADFRDIAGLQHACSRSRRDGFVGRIAIHPDQVATINASYSPSAAEIDAARAVVTAFAAAPDAGAVSIAGRMYDIPHLNSARRLLDAADAGIGAAHE